MEVVVQTVAERLERGEIVSLTPCPFALPGLDDLSFLFKQTVGGIGHKNISYNSTTNQLSGYDWHATHDADNLRRILAGFAAAASQWLGELLPRYTRGLVRDRVSYRPEEEATRKVRLTARNDLLHVDAFPSRPTHGARILRLFVNIHPTEPRVWATADSFAVLLARYGNHLGLRQESMSRWARKVGQGLLSVFRGNVGRGDYDQFMLRLHHFLKSNEEFQERARKKFWQFAPGATWLAFTDGFSHAELRGRFALEHSFFVAPADLVLPELAPAALYGRALGERVRAA